MRPWMRSYIVKPAKIVEDNRMSRDQALPGFPYVSYKGAEVIKMAYALKIVVRNNVVAALYRMEDRNPRMADDMANKTLKDVAHKDFLEVYKLAHSFGNLYGVADRGFEYLGEQPYGRDFTKQDLLNIYNINCVFNIWCDKYRESDTIEWVTQFKVDGDLTLGAASIVWGDRNRTEAKSCQVWEALETVYTGQQVKEIKEIQEKYVKLIKEGKLEDVFPLVPDVYVVNVRGKSAKILKVVENGETCVKEQDVQKWLANKE